MKELLNPVILGQILLAIAAGVATAFQPGVNAKFAEHAGHRIHGGVINFAVGFVAMIVVWAVMRINTPEPARLAQGPWWMWIGGVLGAFFVTTAVFLAPKMGAANYLVALVAGQLVASLLIDQFALVGLPHVAITTPRIIGIVLVIAGMIVVRFG